MEIIYSTTCAICAEKFRYPKHLSDHIDEKHPNIGQVNYFQKYLLKTPDPKFGKCLVCGENPFEPNLTAEEQYNKDKKKKEFAEANGYKLYYIWEDQPENEALNYCLEKLNEVCTN